MIKNITKNRKYKNAAKIIICVTLCILFCVQSAAGRYENHKYTPVFGEEYKNYWFAAGIEDDIAEMLGGISPEIDELLDLYVEYNLYGLDREQAIAIMLRQFLVDYPEMIPYFGNALLKAVDPYGGYYANISTGELFSGMYRGYGIVLDGKEMLSGQRYSVIISNIFDASPALRAGLEIGDEIININGVNLEGFGVNAVSDFLSACSDKISMTVKRDGKEITVSMIRSYVFAQSVSIVDFDDENKTLAIKIDNFTDEYMLYDLYDIFERLEEYEYKNIIIDLRGNRGGDLYNTINFLNWFAVEEGVVLYSEIDKDGNIENIESVGWGLEFEKICVLTNGYSASASEIFALSLRDITGAVIIGEKTYGKGVGQYYIPLENGGTAAITAIELMSPNGTRYHNIGIEPDIKISPEYITVEKEPLGQLNFVNCRNIKKGADNNAVLALNQRLCRMGYISPEDVTGKCTEKTVTAVEIFQKFAGLPVGITKIDYIFLERLSYYVSYYSVGKYQERDVQFECAWIYANEGEEAAEYAEGFARQ